MSEHNGFPFVNEGVHPIHYVPSILTAGGDHTAEYETESV